MSEVITISDAAVEFVNLDLLSKAIKDNGQPGIIIKDYYHKEYPVDTAITTKKVPRGIGFTLNNNKFEVSHDDYGNYKETKALLDKVSQSYQKHAWELVLKKHRYSSTITTKDDKIMITARSY